MAKKISDKQKEVRVDLISSDMGKVTPQAVDIEGAVLGALLIEPDVVSEVIDSLVQECFHNEANRKIFNAIANLYSSHSAIDIFTVADELKKNNTLEEVGGPFYLSQLSSKIGTAAHIEFHVKILLQKYIQRELIKISYQVQKDAYDDSIPTDDLLDGAQEKFFTLADRNMKRDTQAVRSIINQALDDLQSYKERNDGLSGITSGYTGIDRITLGWQNSDLIIVAARPAMGKTAFVLTMARNMTVDHHIPVAFFSLEMSSIQLVKRLMISETGITSEKIKGGKRLDDHEWFQINERLKGLSSAPLYIDDTPSLSIYEFRSKARRLVKNLKVKMIVIDYLQLMTGPPELKGIREQEVSSISRSLKSIAKELNIPIIALSQLSRAVETRGGKRRPQLSDLRESGAIEQDADIVMFIHRPEYYESEDPSLMGTADIIIAKHRNGSVGEVNMKFRAAEAKFVDFNEPDYNSDSSIGVASRMNNPDFLYSNPEFNEK